MAVGSCGGVHIPPDVLPRNCCFDDPAHPAQVSRSRLSNDYCETVGLEDCSRSQGGGRLSVARLQATGDVFGQTAAGLAHGQVGVVGAGRLDALDRKSVV